MRYREKGRPAWKVRIRWNGEVLSAGAGTTDERTAIAVEVFVDQMKLNPEYYPILERIMRREMTLARAYTLYTENRLLLTQPAPAKPDPDLVPILAAWEVRGWTAEGQATLDKYKKQIEPMLGASFKASEFTKARISVYLDGLRKPNGDKPSGSTINRYHTALSCFAKHIVERDIIEANPLRQVTRGKNPKPKPYWFKERKNAQALVMKLPAPYRVPMAFILSCGAEWQVIERLVRSDVTIGRTIEESEVHCWGSKQEHRDRVVFPTEEWAWQIFVDHCRNLEPDAPVFPGLREEAFLQNHKAAMKKLGLDKVRTAPMTIHSIRHAYAVQGLRDGYGYPAMAHNLGHADVTLLCRIYGKWIPNRADFVPRQVVPTAPAVRLEAHA